MVNNQATTADSGWHRALAATVTEPSKLLQLLKLPESMLPHIQAAANAFSLRVPINFIHLMEPGNPCDPLLLQVLPTQAELEPQPGFSSDPLHEQAACKLPGMLRKYQGRVLLILTQACVIHCRYCLRRNFPYQTTQGGQALNPTHWQAILKHLDNDTSVQEVILSGGDPLTIANDKLENLIDSLAAIPHILRLRIHTRIPIVIPQRIDDTFINMLRRTRLQIIIVLHINHPHELTPQAITAANQLATVATLFNQSVLLAGVNDTAETLIALSQCLFQAQIIPYYLHMLDQVHGTAQFAVPVSKALILMHAIRSKLPGYMVPRLAQEHPGQPAKAVIA
ncbi:hypothetical protein TI04_01000 [Achromatium sp. WMS2]|nr:hypothetical protein TI04_01000 [Achromatium sp. WMS2]